MDTIEWVATFNGALILLYSILAILGVLPSS